MNLLLLIRNVIDIRNIFTTVQKDPAPYKFRGMICFYGKHYDAYFYSDFRKQWLVFDDATVKCIGDTWEHVLERCKLGHFHPSVLFYERVPGTYKPAKPVFTSKPKPVSYSSVDLLTGTPSEPIQSNSFDSRIHQVVQPQPIYPVQSNSRPSSPVITQYDNIPSVHPSPLPVDLLSGFDNLNIPQPMPIYNSNESQFNQFHNGNISPVVPEAYSSNTIPYPSRSPSPAPVVRQPLQIPPVKTRRFILGGVPDGYQIIYVPPKNKYQY